MRAVRWLAWLASGLAVMVVAQEEVDNEESRKVLGSSVVTSVSVIMDHGNGTKTYITDAAGQPVDQTDGAVGSPVDLLNPDRYEFYTFDETGDLVKRLMTLDEIKGLLAGGDGETLDNPSNTPTFYHDSLSSSHIDESDLEPHMAQGVHKVVASVQNVLRSELEASKTKPYTKPPLNIPDSISSWSMLFPAIIPDSSEVLDDGNDSGNSVNDPIDGGDRLPASSNVEKTEVKVAPHDSNTQKVDSKTEMPTVVPPIIHFLEIQSVPSPAKAPTKTPIMPSTTPIMTSTTEPPTTGKPTSPVNPIKEMSASISSLLSQVTDNQTSGDVMNTAQENKISVNSAPAPTSESLNQTPGTKMTEKTPIVIKPLLKPESSNVNTVTKNPPETSTKPVSTDTTGSSQKLAVTSNNKDSKPNLATISTATEEDTKQGTTESLSPIKKTPDTVVNLITTSKPATTNAVKTSNKAKPSNSVASSTLKQKLQSTTPTPSSTLKKNNIKNQNSTSKPPAVTSKKPSKPSINKTNQASETLEAHGSEEIYKIVPNKQSQNTLATNKIKVNQTKINANSNTTMARPSTKPVKKVPNNKPHGSQGHIHDSDCTNLKKTPPLNDTKNKEKLEVAASTNINERINPSNINSATMQEIKTIQKPAAVQINKPTASKIKPSEEVKITTYKPSTTQPFTTKQSIHKISTTTERPLNNLKIPSESKIHEVNSSLFDIKDVTDLQRNDTQIQLKNSTPNSIKSQYQGAASNTDEIKVAIEQKNNTSSNLTLTKEHNETDTINHKTEAECTHSKKPLHSSIQDKIGDLNEEAAASNSEGVNLTTLSSVPTTEITTDSSKDVTTTETVSEISTKVADEDVFTTTEQSEDKATDLPETTTLNMPEIDFVKEGISAVTNILLDQKPPLEPQLPIPTLPLSESESNIVLSPPVKGELKHASSFDDFEMTTTDIPEVNTTSTTSPTTEKELIVYFTTTDPPVSETITAAASKVEKESIIYFTTTDAPMTETEPQTTENNVSTKSGEDITEEIVTADTTPSIEDFTTETSKDVAKETSESKVVSTVVNNQTLPTKESKLSPENINETSDNQVLCNHTLAQLNNKNDSAGNNNKTETKDQLEPAQSIISENRLTEESSTPTTTLTLLETTLKNTLKDESYNIDFKTALKPEPPKFTQTKYPNLQNGYRPFQDAPLNPPSAVELHPAPHESMGLEATTAFLADDVRRFSDLCNELAFRMWTSITGKGSISSRSLVLSPFATTSLLAMVFLGARGPTSGQMNDVLRLDDMVTFNPHQVLQNVTESVLNSRNYGVTTAAFVRELYSDKLKGKILDFYKERAQQYYDGHVEEIAFNNVGDILRRRTNLLVKRQTLGKVPEYLRGSNLNLRPPLAAFSANIFQTDCDLASTEGRDGEMYFVVRPSTRQRRLVPVPAAVWRTGFLAGYEPGLDATAVALGTDSVVSTILVLPGQQGQVAPGDGLARLEQRLIETSYRRGGWTRLLRSLLPRPGLELQVPRFSHRSVLNITSTLQRMGLKDLFNENRADLRGLNGLSNDLHLSDIVQVNTFSTCGEDTIGARHHIETYPVSPQRMGRDDPELYPRPEDFEDPELLKIPLNLRPRQARLPDNPRLRFDRPFLYMVRHNPTGMILHMGRFNPRLLP